MLHNCGSFDGLIRHLKCDCHTVAIDLPGHGFSSHFPQGIPLEFNNFVLCIKRAADFLKWPTFTYIGHSFGGQIGIYFAAIFPQYLDALVVIDTMEPRPVPLEDTLSHLKSNFDKFFEMEKKLENNTAPVYSFEQAFDKVRQNNLWPLSQGAAENLMQRSVTPCGGGFTFVFDQRLKQTIRPNLTFKQQSEFLKNIYSPTLFILADQNMARYGTYLKSVFEFIKTKDNCSIVIVKGDHAVHQNYPERVSCLIDEFLKKITTK